MSKVILHTNGNGLWSDVERAVRIENMVLDVGTEYEDDKTIFGEFRVYFNTEDWDTSEDGLIYTDKGFLRELREFLNAHGLPGKDVCYSEQGMQGDDYVSLDAGTDFYNAWIEKFELKREDMVEVW